MRITVKKLQQEMEIKDKLMNTQGQTIQAMSRELAAYREGANAMIKTVGQLKRALELSGEAIKVAANAVP